MNNFRKRYPTEYTFVMGFILCAVVTITITVLDFYFYDLWVGFGSVLVGIVVLFFVRRFALLFGKLSPVVTDHFLFNSSIPVYVRRDNKCNAFANGLGNQKVTVFNSKTLEILNEEEVKAVMMHELAHHHYNDATWGTMLALLIANSIASFSVWIGSSISVALLIALGLCVPGVLLYLIYSRAKEVRADKYAAKHLDNPKDLAIGLRKMIEDAISQGYNFSRKKTFVVKYLATHPFWLDRVEFLSGK